MAMCWRYSEANLRCFFLLLFINGFLSWSFANGNVIEKSGDAYTLENLDLLKGGKPIIHLLDKREADITDIPSKISKTTGPPKKATSKAVEPTKAVPTKTDQDDKIGYPEPHTTTPSYQQTTTRSYGPTTTPQSYKHTLATEDELTVPPNITKINDTHIYYNSSFIMDAQEAMSYWVDFDNLPENHTTIHDMLSNSHRRADTIPLSFDFPFYGHKLKNITIATGGFLYTGEHMHNWLAATQYIAPFMANFDTSLKNTSHILYYDNGTAFTVYWKNAPLQDKPYDGDFSFQVTLLNNGDIVFVYKEIPIPVTDINDLVHPVKIGLSDAYVVDKLVFYFQKKTIYEYHRVDLKSYNVSNETAIYFQALPTCITYTNCSDCMSSQLYFKCRWCEKAKRCSAGTDRYRQDWFTQQCDQLSDVTCPAPGASIAPTVVPEASVTSSVQPTVEPVSPINPSSKTPPSPGASSLPISSPLPPLVPRPTIPSPPQGSSPSSAEPSGSELSPAVRVQPNPIVADKDVHIAKVHKESKSSKNAGTLVAVLTVIALIGGVALWGFYAYKNPQSPSGQLLIKYRPTQWRWKHGEARYTAASSIHI